MRAAYINNDNHHTSRNATRITNTQSFSRSTNPTAIRHRCQHFYNFTYTVAHTVQILQIFYGLMTAYRINLLPRARRHTHAHRARVIDCGVTADNDFAIRYLATCAHTSRSHQISDQYDHKCCCIRSRSSDIATTDIARYQRSRVSDCSR